MDSDGAFKSGLEKAYPEGLAQLFGLAFIDPKSEVLEAIKKFPLDQSRNANMGAERWLVAASKIGGATEKEWRDAVVKTDFKDKYCYRPAIALLSLLEGADWMTTVGSGK
jgi:hypothetical protein